MTLNWRFDVFHRNWSARSHAWPGGHWIVNVDRDGTFLGVMIDGPFHGAILEATLSASQKGCERAETVLAGVGVQSPVCDAA